MTNTLTRPRQGYTDFLMITDSSVIRSLYYDAVDEKLFVDLISGTVAAYRGISKEDWLDLFSAESVGKHWNRKIRFKRKGISSDVELVRREDTAPVVVDQQETVKDKPMAAQDPNYKVNYLWQVTVEVEGGSYNEAVANLSSGVIRSITR